MPREVFVRPCETPEDYGIARLLFQEYERDLGFSLCFQGFAKELETLDTMYGAAVGGLWLAERSGEPVGCVGLRRHNDRTGEVKRLYVRPESRGLGAGRALMTILEERARHLGYTSLILDTMPTMVAAIGLYQSLGFALIHNPEPGAHALFMTKSLD